MMTNTVVVNDFHTGSYYSMCHPEVDICLTEENGNEIEIVHRALTKSQLPIYERYKLFCELLDPIDILVINGDMTEGVNPKGRGEGIWTTSVRGQVVESVNLIEELPIKKNTQIYVTYSSGYHTGHNPSSDELLCMELRARGYENVKLSYDWLLEIHDCRFHFCHSIGVAQNKVTSLSKEIDWALINSKDYGDIHGIVRAHCHYGSETFRDGTYAWIVPGWKGRDEFVASKGLRYNPGIGGLNIQVPNTGTQFFSKLYNWTLKYPLKTDKAV